MAKREKKLIVGNWKLNPATLAEAVDLVSEVIGMVGKPKVDVVLCPPAVFTPGLLLSGKKGKVHVGWGAQNCATQKVGAYTGEISPSMLASAGCTHVIVGHSERRAMGETDAMVAQKTALALKEGLTVILCVGELVRDEHGEYIQELERQIVASVPQVSRRMLDRLVIAYEPIWAIGAESSRSASPSEVFESAILIRKILSHTAPKEFALKVKLLYGGSVEPTNAREIVEKGGVQGLLVGRDSIDPARFSAIIREVEAAG